MQKIKNALSFVTGREDVYPLSTNQIPIWYQKRIRPDAPAYLWHLPVGIWLDGVLDVDVFKRCLSTLIQRHEVARTTFGTSWRGQPQQYVHKTIEWTLDEEDLRRIPKDDVDEVLNSRLRAKLHPPFDWKKQPPWRIGLYRLGDEKHLFFIALHHIICDAWSLAVFFREFTTLYDAFANGQPSPLPPLKARYKDYVASQADRLKSGALESKFLYWEKVFTPAPKFLDGLTDYPLVTPQPYEGQVASFVLPDALGQNLKTISRDLKTTPFGFLLSNFFLLLHHRTHQEDLFVAMPSANRMRAKYKDVMGCYARSAPIRAQVLGHLTFENFARQIHQSVRQTLLHQDVALYEVFKRLAWQSLEPIHALYQTYFMYQNLLIMQEQKGDLVFSLDLMWNLLGFARSDLIFQFFETPQGVEGHVEYNSGYFKTSTIDMFIDTYLQLLTQTVSHPQDSIHSIVRGL